MMSDFDDLTLPADVPQLSLLVGQTVAETSIWVYHGALEKSVRYDGVQEADHILTWAKIQLIQLSLPEISNMID